MEKTIEQVFSEMVALLRLNYGRDHYPQKFVDELFAEVMDVDPEFLEKELRGHMRFYGETKDRPKIQAFAKIRRDWVEKNKPKPPPEPPNRKGSLNLHGFKNVVELLEKIETGEFVLPPKTGDQ